MIQGIISAAIGCTKSNQPIGVTLHTRNAMRALKVSYGDVGEGGVAVKCEKTIFFLNTLYLLRDIFRARGARQRQEVLRGQPSQYIPVR